MKYSENPIINGICMEAETNGYNKAKNEILEILKEYDAGDALIYFIEDLENLEVFE